MTNYIFKTAVTMKEYNQEKYWIDKDIIKTYYITAENVKEALKKYVENVTTGFYAMVEISKNAIKNKQPMYCDTTTGTKQIGYVLTGKTDIDNKTQYVNLWVNIIQTVDTDF